jgi:hypothetical protein
VKAELSEILSNLHLALSKELLSRIQNGTATAADLSVAAKFLKDHGITVNPEAMDGDNPIKSLQKVLSDGGPLPFPVTVEEAVG